MVKIDKIYYIHSSVANGLSNGAVPDSKNH